MSIYSLIFWEYTPPEKSDEEKFKDKIREFVNNIEFNKSYEKEVEDLVAWKRYKITQNISIYIELFNDENIYNIRVNNKQKNIYFYVNQSRGDEFWQEIWQMILDKLKDYKKIKDEEYIRMAEKEEKYKKEREELEKSILIQEALAELMLIDMSPIQKEVKDEFDPIFTKVKRVLEITKELEGIRKEFSIT